MELKYRGIAYTLAALTTEYPFTASGCYRGFPTQFGGPQPKLWLRKPRHRLVYRGVPYEA